MNSYIVKLCVNLVPGSEHATVVKTVGALSGTKFDDSETRDEPA